jgi:tetratricopeptide (TPR) repeat protein
LAKARTAAQQALELDAGVTGARQAFARVTAYLEHDWRIAADELRRAMALRPSMGSIHTELGLVLSALGRGAEAITETTRGLELDPFSERARGAAGLALVGARRYEDAAALAGRVLARDDRSAAAHYVAGLAHHGAGRTADAVAALQRARQLDAASLAIESSLAAALAASGDRASASASLADLVRRAKGAEISPYYIALIEAALGQPDAALRRLEEADRERSPRVRELRVHPVWNALQGDRRFVQLLARLGM